jgi:threonine dehydrogenase-like Zn-dependent dehydrogenase
MAGGAVPGNPAGGTVVILGLGPIGSMAARVATHLGASKVIGVDLVPERLERARRHGADVLDLTEFGENQQEVAVAIRDLLGRARRRDRPGRDGGSRVRWGQGRPSGHWLVARQGRGEDMEHQGVDRLAALQLAIEVVRRGGTISLAGVYGGMSDPLPMMVMFDKQLQLRMGQANVKRWIDGLLPLVTDQDVLHVEDFASHSPSR